MKIFDQVIPQSVHSYSFNRVLKEVYFPVKNIGINFTYDYVVPLLRLKNTDLY